jgi:hypothetical protein
MFRDQTDVTVIEDKYDRTATRDGLKKGLWLRKLRVSGQLWLLAKAPIKHKVALTPNVRALEE